MRRRNFTLPDDLDEQLTAEADRQGVGASELIREAVTLRLAYAASVQAGKGADVDALLGEILAVLERIERSRREPNGTP